MEQFKDNVFRLFQNVTKHSKNMLHIVLKSVYFKYFLAFVGIYLIALSALFRANFNYIDDIERVFFGYQFHFSRYLSDFLSTIIHDGSYLGDISPFTQIIAAIIIAIASVLAIFLLTGKQKNSKFNFWLVLAALPIGLSPYFMENFSYKFDSPYMAFSILFSILPLLFYTKQRKNLKFCLVSILCTIAVCTTYQASLGIFPTMVLLMAFLMFNRKESWKEFFRFIASAIVSYLIGLLIFRFFIMESVHGYVSHEVFGVSEFIPGVYHNYRHFFGQIRRDFRLHWLIPLAIIVVSFIITSVCETRQKKSIATIGAIVTMLGTIMLSFGIYVVMAKTLFVPRSMYGFFVNIALLAIVAVSYQKPFAIIPKLSALYIGYAFIVFALVYGNALAVQKAYMEHRIELVNSDLNEISVNSNEPVQVDVDGSIGLAPSVAALTSKYPVLKQLVPILFGDDEWVFGVAYMYTVYPLNNVQRANNEYDKNDMELIRKTRTHDIYQRGHEVLVELK